MTQTAWAQSGWYHSTGLGSEAKTEEKKKIMTNDVPVREHKVDVQVSRAQPAAQQHMLRHEDEAGCWG